MSLYSDWESMVKMVSDRPDSNKYWEDYFDAEKENYIKILAGYPKIYEGKISDLASEFDMENVVLAGFLDGINESLKEPLILDTLEEDTEVKLDIDYEKLYFNMLKAKADWLYRLEEWDGILTEERRSEITKEFRESVVAKSDKVGRNDPCPCGSGKKYKKCCGA